MWSAARSSFLGEKQSSAKGRKLQKDKDRSELVQIMVSERFLWETSRQARNEGLDYLIGQRKEERCKSVYFSSVAELFLLL